MLYEGGASPGKQADPYKTAVIDTIVAEVQSTPGEDRCVLLLGYRDQIVEMFQVSPYYLGGLHLTRKARTSTLAYRVDSP